VVGLGRFELPTSPLSGVRSNQLSYRPGISTRNHPWPGSSLGLHSKTGNLLWGLADGPTQPGQARLNCLRSLGRS
jgi:hypothetical protein